MEELDAEIVIEFLGDVAGQLQMLLLVLAHRHMGRLIGQDVGRHQAGIDHQPGRGVLAVLAGLVLELGHAVQPADPGDAIENPGELGMLGDLALVEDDAGLGIDPRREIAGGHAPRVLAQLRGIVRHGDRVHVDHAEDGLEVFLHADPVADRAEIIAEMGNAGRLNAGKDAALLVRHDSSPVGEARGVIAGLAGAVNRPSGSGVAGVRLARRFRSARL